MSNSSNHILYHIIIKKLTIFNQKKKKLKIKNEFISYFFLVTCHKINRIYLINNINLFFSLSSFNYPTNQNRKNQIINQNTVSKISL